MKNAERKFGAPEWLINIGGSFFILVLAVSAVWDSSIRWLHFFQAWMYIATIWLGVRRNRWGYFIGISAAGFGITRRFLRTLFWRADCVNYRNGFTADIWRIRIS